MDIYLRVIVCVKRTIQSIMVKQETIFINVVPLLLRFFSKLRCLKRMNREREGKQVENALGREIINFFLYEIASERIPMGEHQMKHLIIYEDNLCAEHLFRIGGTFVKYFAAIYLIEEVLRRREVSEEFRVDSNSEIRS